MENKIDNKIDELLRQVEKSSLAKKPGVDFTANVMNRVHKEAAVRTTASYQPLISKKIGWAIFTAIIISLGYFAYINDTASSWLPELNLTKINLPSLTGLFGQLTVSNTILYAFLFLGIMLFIQISWLKINHDKKWHS